MKKLSTIPQLLERFVNPVDFSPAPPLLDWLKWRGVEHNGVLDGEEEFWPQAIAPATQRQFQRYHPSGIPMARTEVDIRAEDLGHSQKETERRMKHLASLGLLSHNIAFPDRPPDCLLLHASYLPGLLHQYDTLLQQWQRGLRWKKLVFLGAARSVGRDVPLKEILKICTNRRRYQAMLQAVYDQQSLYWYAPNASIAADIWHNLPIPDDMRQVPVQWIAAQDGTDRLANTQDTLETFAQHHQFDQNCQYGICTCAPMTLRQWLITAMFLHKHMPGFLQHNDLPVICAPAAQPLSLWVAEREASNVLWELCNMKRLGIGWART